MQTPTCDLCGQNQISILYAGDTWQVPAPAGIALVRCENCHLMYLNPRPGTEEIAEYYPEDYGAYHTAVEDERSTINRWLRRRKWAKRRKIIEQLSKRSQGYILDVGSSTGLFLNEMVQAGWQASGVELSHSAANYARNRFNLDIFEGTLPEAPFPSKLFDVITFWDVLEHTQSPKANLNRAYELLKVRGCILVHIPNWDSLDRKIFEPYWCGYDPPRHLYTFTSQTMDSLLRETGFIPITSVSFIPGYSYATFVMSFVNRVNFSAPFLGKHLQAILNWPGTKLPFIPFFMLMDTIGFGGGIAHFAVKSKVQDIQPNSAANQS